MCYEWMNECVLQVVADYFGAGIDDTHIKMRGAPVLEEPSLSSHQKMIADKLTVSELMTMAVVALPPVVKVRRFCCAAQLMWCCSMVQCPRVRLQHRQALEPLFHALETSPHAYWWTPLLCLLMGSKVLLFGTFDLTWSCSSVRSFELWSTRPCLPSRNSCEVRQYGFCTIWILYNILCHRQY